MIRLTLALSLLLCGAQNHLFAQSPATADNEAVVYLRFANLLPLSQDRVTLNRGSEVWVSGAKPGFFMGYTPLSKEGGWSFSVQNGSRPVGTFKLKDTNLPRFYTAVVYASGGKSVLYLNEDNPQPEEEEDKDKDPGTPAEPAPPQHQMHGYFGGFDFPYTVDAGDLGSWEISNQGQVISVPVAGATPPTVRVHYEDRFGEPIDIYFPLDFSSSGSASVFVSQRGNKRPRVQSYPDNLPPMEPTEPPALDAAVGQPAP